MNQKGGVGKTTTTANLGAALAAAGKRVCLIDVDPQAHLTINYGLEPAEERISLYDVLAEEKSFDEATHSVGENIWIVPSSIDLAGAEIELVSVIGREMLLKKAVDASTQKYDFVLLDCPPSLGILTINALSLAKEVIIPMQPQFLPLQGMAKLLETVQLVHKRMNPSLNVTGVVLTMFDSQAKLSNEVVAPAQAVLRAGEIVRRVHRAQDRIRGHAAVEPAHHGGDLLLAEEQVDGELGFGHARQFRFRARERKPPPSIK